MHPPARAHRGPGPGTKNPDIARILHLAPDLVIASKEENRRVDVRRLRESGVPVWVTVIETVPQALDSLTRLFADGLRWGVPGWLADVRAAWDRPVPEARARVAVPIWRDPWMVVGRDTFTGDLLRRRGYRNMFADHPERYPTVNLAEIDRADVDLILLPDEPYPFTATDGPVSPPRAPRWPAGGCSPGTAHPYSKPPTSPPDRTTRRDARRQHPRLGSIEED